MNVNFDFENVLYSIEQELAKVPVEIKSQTKTVIKKASKILEKNVIQELTTLPDSEAQSNYDGSQPYLHMKDDVKTSVRDDKQGTIYAIIRGGKYTGYKWHLVNNGTMKSRATHFIDKAMKQSENEISQLIDEMIAKAVK